MWVSRTIGDDADGPRVQSLNMFCNHGNDVPYVTYPRLFHLSRYKSGR